MADYPTTEFLKLEDYWTNTISSLGASGMQLAILILLTIIFTIALLYMLAVAFRNDRFKYWLTGELMQAFASALMIFGLISLAAFLTDLSYFVGGVTCSSPVDAGWGISGYDVNRPLEYVACKFDLLDQQLAILYQDVVAMNMPVERAEWSCWIFFGTEIHCGWDLHPLVESLHALAYKIVQYRIGINAALILVTYMSEWLLPIFLPIGIILRAIPFTRGAGGLVIALVLGFYFVFPMIFTLSDLLLSQQLGRPDLNFVDASANTCVYSDLSGAMSINAIDSGIAQQAALAVPEIRSLLAAIVIQALLAPLMALAATIFFVRAFSPILGSDSHMVIYGLTKLL
ncbi:hypothetical protein DRN67_02145 [Candidatus Micrarchaeota archaeon]|nr:MAG: hypothetical protein DRN67_02145 [Candidatus Micrarchaeota archaeon]